MSSPPSPPLSAGQLLFPHASSSDPATTLARTLAEKGARQTITKGLRHLSASAARAIDSEVAAIASGLLDIDVGDALVLGWRKHAQLTQAGRRTLAAPSSVEVVDLLTHRVTSSFRPSVDLMVDGVRVNSFEFDLSIVFDLTGISVVVKRGDLVIVRGGGGLVTAKLTLEGAQLAEAKHHLDVEVVLPLRKPVPLTDRSALIPSQRQRGRLKGDLND